MSKTAAIRGERINLRLDAAAKHRIERAAALDGRTVSGFILDRALSSADRTIREHERMTLGERDAQVFFDALLNPPGSNEQLVEAMEEYRRRVTSR